jgi:hypothetical protein
MDREAAAEAHIRAWAPRDGRGKFDCHSSMPFDDVAIYRASALPRDDVICSSNGQDMRRMPHNSLLLRWSLQLGPRL